MNDLTTHTLTNILILFVIPVTPGYTEQTLIKKRMKYNSVARIEEYAKFAQSQAQCNHK